MKYYALFILLFVQYSHHAIGQETFENQKAPSLEITKWFAPEPPDLENRVVVLEFWATWCAPCINAIPHMNELAQKFSDEPVVFVSINSHENAETITKFIETTSFETIVAQDKGQFTYDFFGVNLLPTTCIIDKEGYLRWRGDPGQLTEELLTTLLTNNELVKVTPNQLSFSYSIAAAKDRSISKIILHKGDEFGFEFHNKELQTILGQLFSFTGVKDNELRYANRVPIEPHVDMSFKADSTYDQIEVYQTVIQNLALTFQFSVDTITEQQDIIEMKIVNPVLFEKAKVANDAPYSQSKENGFASIKGISGSKFLNHMEYVGKKPVYFDGKIEGKFDCSYFINDFKKTQEHLEKNFGIALSQVEKPTRVILVTF